jgi:CubicO group peptidase (beta-lactamase class C family)
VRVAADSTINLPAGSSFTAPANWYVSDEKGMLLLQDPDQQLRCAFVEAADSTALAAIANAWQRVEPGFSRAIHRTVSPPARDGWDEIVQNVYETTSAEAKTIIGLARRKGATWHVNLLEGPDGAMEKRSAQMNTAIGTWKPKGLQEESFAGRTAHALDATRLAALERFIEDARTQTKVPGASIAIVQGGRVVYEKGFGVRRVGGKEPVTSKTLFMIGSMTKSLTTLMMAKLVDEGRFQWDTPVVKVYPRFSLADPDVTPKVTMAHTVCACTGLPRQDMEFLFEYAQATPEMRVASMGRMKTTTGFGETFQYSNTMVSTGGYVAAYSADPKGLLGPAYDRVMQSRVFDPLGMTATTFDPAVAKGREHATPHGRTLTLDFTPIQIENEAGVISVRPAGAAWSNVEDLSRYLTTELSGGLGPSGTRVVSTENLLKRREPQTRMSDKMTYGLGLMAQDDHGVKVFTHGGNNLGYTADMYFLPEQGVGGVLLTNGQGANFFAGVVRRRLMELLFDGREEAASMLAFGVKQQGEIARKTLEYVLPVPEKDWMAKWNGSYASPDLGTITVRTRGSESLLDAGEWKCAAGEKKEKDGSRTLILTGPPLTGLEFIPTEAGGTTTLTLKTPQQEYVFTKSGGKSAAASAR